MVRWTEDNELGDTKPHLLRDFEELTQSVKAVKPSSTADGAGIDDTEPVIDVSGEERLVSLSKVLSVFPEQPQARRNVYAALRDYLTKNPFLRYLEESDVLYQVITGGGRVVVVPKDRAAIPSYPLDLPRELKLTYRWLSFAAFGLLLAGLGTVICAPIAAMFAWRASLHSPNTDERKRAGRALIYAGTLWGVGLMFAFLFLLHFQL